MLVIAPSNYGYPNLTMVKAPTARASAIDMMHSSSRSTGVIGPISGLDHADVADRFTRLARVGPAARVGFRPAAGTHRWVYETEVAHRVMELPTPTDPAALLTEFREPSIQLARVGVAGEYFLFDYNHGIGDIALLSRFLEVMLCGVDPQRPDLWTAHGRVIPPLVAAAARTYAVNPKRLLDMAWWYRRSGRPQPKPTAIAPTPPVDRSIGVPSTATARISAAALDELRLWRDDHQPGVSVVVLVVLALRHALEKAGIATTDRVTLPFDARVYLPKSRRTLANFAAGLDFDYRDSVSPQGLQHAITEAFAIGRPVANLVISNLKVQANRLPGLSPTTPSSAPTRTERRASLLYSSLNRVPRDIAIPWADTAPAQFLVASDPAGPDAITVTSAIADGDLTMTAVFHDSVFDQKSVAAALTHAATDTAALVDPGSAH